MSRPEVAIWNPASGNAPHEADLRGSLGPDVELVETTEDDPGPGQTRSAVEQHAATVIVCGGDGTIRACLEPLLGTETTLDLVPLGTGNLLAGNLGIDAGLDAAATRNDRTRRRIDVGFVNGEAFAVMAGSGFDAHMIGDADGEAKDRFGRLAYVASGARHLRERLERTTVEIDGEPWFSGRTSMVLVGNFGSITGGLEVFPDARPDDGRLDVAVTAADSLRDWMSVLTRLLSGRPQRLDLVRRSQGSEIRVTTQRPRVYELDGEDREPTRDLRFSVRKQALSVACDASTLADASPGSDTTGRREGVA